MSEIAALRNEVAVLQRRITAQRKELGRLYTDNCVLSDITSRLNREYWALRKQEFMGWPDTTQGEFPDEGV